MHMAPPTHLGPAQRLGRPTGLHVRPLEVRPLLGHVHELVVRSHLDPDLLHSDTREGGIETGILSDWRCRLARVDRLLVLLHNLLRIVFAVEVLPEPRSYKEGALL